MIFAQTANEGALQSYLQHCNQDKHGDETDGFVFNFQYTVGANVDLFVGKMWHKVAIERTDRNRKAMFCSGCCLMRMNMQFNRCQKQQSRDHVHDQHSGSQLLVIS